LFFSLVVEASVIFYSDATLVDEMSKYETYKEMQFRLDESHGHQKKSVYGEYWYQVYKFNSKVSDKEFISFIKKFIVKNDGKVLLSGRDYIYCSIMIEKRNYWAKITYDSYERDRYSIELIKVGEKKKLVTFYSDGLKKAIIKSIVGFKKDEFNSEYKRYTKEEIAISAKKQEFEGEYWFEVYKKVDTTLVVDIKSLIGELKGEIKQYGGKIEDESKKSLGFSIKNKTRDIVGRFEVSKDICTIKIIDKVGFKQSLKFEDGSNMVIHDILFNSGKSTLQKSSSSGVKKIYNLLKKFPSLSVEIQGHTDNIGESKTNKMLSQQRADSVKKALMKLGIDSSRLKTKGLGDSNPISSNRTKEGRAKNRRVELLKLSNQPRISIEIMKPMDGYSVTITKFKSSKLSNKNISLDIVGVEHRAMYIPSSKKNIISKLEVLKNYLNYIKSLGGKIVENQNSSILFHFNKTVENSEIYGKINAFDDYYYISFFYPKDKE
jgi:outer membrane protein OmpA-like peptidoglycan-associated protein